MILQATGLKEQTDSPILLVRAAADIQNVPSVKGHRGGRCETNAKTEASGYVNDVLNAVDEQGRRAGCLGRRILWLRVGKRSFLCFSLISHGDKFRPRRELGRSRGRTKFAQSRSSRSERNQVLTWTATRPGRCLLYTSRCV